MHTSGHYDVIIAGAGQAAAQCAQSLRQGGFVGTIAMIGDEDAGPYERPPLSKAYLGGKLESCRLQLRKPEFWQEKSVSLLTGRTITVVNPATRMLTLADGARFSYGDLVWATGGAPPDRSPAPAPTCPVSTPSAPLPILTG